MKNQLLILSLLLTSMFGFSQSGINVHISGNIFNSAEDSIYLAQYMGTHYVDFAGAKFDKDRNFDIKTSLPNADYYVLRIGNEHVNLVLRDKSEIKVYGDAKKLNEFSNIVGSDESASLQRFAFLADRWNHRKDSAIALMQQDPTQKDKINSEMQHYLLEFQNDYRTFISENQNSPALIVALSVIDPTNDFAGYESIVKQLTASFSQSPTIQAVQQNYLQYKAQLDANNLLAPGKPAPDFEALKLDRKSTMKLSDLKGQVVLLDFWASWCGPCRKENPNVVNVYNKYKDEGFTVMSVSLDDNLERWKQAIEADGLKWPNHVSDLKKWSSEYAKLYQVRGIPFTVLIDKEGNIFQTNVRGAALEVAVKELLAK